MFFFSSRRRHTRYWRDWSSDVCSSDLWVLYRSTAEALKHAKCLFLSCAGPYATADRPRVLAERVEGLVSQEHAKWTEEREQAEPRSEEHTSELQSRQYLVCRLLLEKNTIRRGPR